MAIKLKCPNCRERLFADESDRGGSIKCDGCGTRVPVPGDGGDAPAATKSTPAAPAIPTAPVARPAVVNAEVVTAKPRSAPALAIPTVAPVTVAPVAKPRSRANDDEDDLDERPRPRRRAADDEDDDFPSPANKGNGLLFGILALGIVLLTGIGVGVYYLVAEDEPALADNTNPDGTKPNPDGTRPNPNPPINPNPINPNPPKENRPPVPVPPPKPPETPFEPLVTADDEGFAVQMPGGAKVKGVRHVARVDNGKYHLGGKKFEAKDGPFTFTAFYHDLVDEADYDADKCFQPLVPFPWRSKGSADEQVAGKPGQRWTLQQGERESGTAVTVRVGFRVFTAVVTRNFQFGQEEAVGERGKQFLDSLAVTFDPKKAPTELLDPTWVPMAKTVGFTATAPRGTRVDDYRRGFQDSLILGKSYAADDSVVECKVWVVEIGPKVDPQAAMKDMYGFEKILDAPKKITHGGLDGEEFALAGFNGEVHARVRAFLTGANRNVLIVLKAKGVHGQPEREIALKSRAFFNSFKFSGSGVAGGGTVTVGNGEFASAGKVQPFATAVILPTKKELITLGARNPTEPKPGGILRRYSYPDFKLKATYHLPLPVTHAVADEAGGKLLCAVVGTWPGPQVIDPREGDSWYADLHLFDLTRITTDGLYGDGEELKPLGGKITLGPSVVVTGLAADPTGKFAYAAASITPAAKSKLPPSGRLYKIDLGKGDLTGTPLNHKEPLNGLRVQAGGKALVTTELALGGAMRQVNLVLVDPSIWKVSRLLPLPDKAKDPKDATFTGDGVLALLPVDARNVILGAADGAAETTDVTPKDIPLDGFAFLRVTPDGKRAVASAGKKQNGLLLMKVTGEGDKAKFEKVTSGTTVAGAPVGGQFVLTPDSKFAVFNCGAVVDLEKTTPAPKE